MSDQGPWVTKTILELEERVAELTEEIKQPTHSGKNSRHRYDP